MQINIPGRGVLTIETIILDLNGTIAVDGALIQGVQARLNQLKQLGVHCVLLSGDTHGNAGQIAEQLQIRLLQAATAAEKSQCAQQFNLEQTAAIGNGLIDAELMKAVELGIVVLQAEGVHTQALLAADIVVPSILDALDLFLQTKRLVATLRQ